MSCKNVAHVIVCRYQPTCVVWFARKLLYTSLARLVTPWQPALQPTIPSFYAPWETDRRTNKNGKPHMKRSCLNERGRPRAGRRTHAVSSIVSCHPCQETMASFVPLRQAKGTKRRTHYRGLPSMAAGGKYGEGKWDAGENRGGRPLGRRPLFFPSLGPACLPPRLHAATVPRLHVTRLCVLLTVRMGGRNSQPIYAFIFCYAIIKQ